VTGFLDLSTSMTLNDLEPLKKKFLLIFFCNFWMQRTLQHWIATKWLEIYQDNLRMKFSAFNVDFSSSSFDTLGSKWPAQAGVKDSYPLKSGYFIAIISCSVNTVADRHRHAAYHNKHWWQAFQIYQHRWPWMTLNFPKMGFSEFFGIFGCCAHFDHDNLRMKFSALNVDFSSLSPDPLSSWSPAQWLFYRNYLV